MCAPSTTRSTTSPTTAAHVTHIPSGLNFAFDKRTAVAPAEADAKRVPLSHCILCQAPWDTYLGVVNLPHPPAVTLPHPPAALRSLQYCIRVTHPERLTFGDASACVSPLALACDACIGKRKCALCDIPVLVCLACCDGRRDKAQGVVLKCDLCVEQGSEGNV
jgi:hypothetical protein